VIVPAAMAVPVAAGKTRMRVGLMPWLPIPASVQPLEPHQFVFAPARGIGVEPDRLHVERIGHEESLW